MSTFVCAVCGTPRRTLAALLSCCPVALRAITGELENGGKLMHLRLDEVLAGRSTPALQEVATEAIAAAHIADLVALGVLRAA